MTSKSAALKPMDSSDQITIEDIERDAKGQITKAKITIFPPSEEEKATAKFKMQRAVSQLILNHPFFAALTLGMKVHPWPDNYVGPGWTTMGTNGKEIIYSVKFVNKMSEAEVIGVIAHEAMHVACAHTTRMRGRKPRLWNVAGDFCINSILLESGFTLPEGGCVDLKYDGMSAEEVYRLLEQEKPKKGKGKGQGQPQFGDGDPDGDGEGEEDGGDPAGCGVVLEPTGPNGEKLSQADLAQAEQENKMTTMRAAAAAKAQGKLPGNLARLLDELCEAKVNWTVVLADFIDRNAKNDFSYHRPSPRFVQQGLYLPTIHSMQMGTIAICVDTSGSIGQEELMKFGAEIKTIFDRCKPEKVYVIYCDSAVAHVDEFESGDDLQLAPHGGGGTCFKPGFEWLNENGVEPVCLVYLTDLCCNSYPEPPSYPTLWVSTHPGSEPPFGEVLVSDL